MSIMISITHTQRVQDNITGAFTIVCPTVPRGWKLTTTIDSSGTQIPKTYDLYTEL